MPEKFNNSPQIQQNAAVNISQNERTESPTDIACSPKLEFSGTNRALNQRILLVPVRENINRGYWGQKIIICSDSQAVHNWR
ncbi:hypothetical protein JTB14_030882 [Gonioctena quinquepunctata]|nr:hypothetical protein JTB14_030882 [Gonioctena quinquepunctata]